MADASHPHPRARCISVPWSPLSEVIRMREHNLVSGWYAWKISMFRDAFLAPLITFSERWSARVRVGGAVQFQSTRRDLYREARKIATTGAGISMGVFAHGDHSNRRSVPWHMSKRIP